MHFDEAGRYLSAKRYRRRQFDYNELYLYFAHDTEIYHTLIA